MQKGRRRQLSFPPMHIGYVCDHSASLSDTEIGPQSSILSKIGKMVRTTASPPSSNRHLCIVRPSSEAARSRSKTSGYKSMFRTSAVAKINSAGHIIDKNLFFSDEMEANAEVDEGQMLQKMREELRNPNPEMSLRMLESLKVHTEVPVALAGQSLDQNQCLGAHLRSSSCKQRGMFNFRQCSEGCGEGTILIDQE